MVTKLSWVCWTAPWTSKCTYVCCNKVQEPPPPTTVSWSKINLRPTQSEPLSFPWKTRTLKSWIGHEKSGYEAHWTYLGPDKLLNRIQRIQNYAARVVLRLHKFSHITPALATLHWLPVKRRIDFKIALLVYKALNGQAPAYIADLLQPYDPPRKLRSADKQLLSQPPCRLKSYGDRAFCCAAPVVWNNIPHSVKTAKTVDNFKVKLKTHFYSVSFA